MRYLTFLFTFLLILTTTKDAAERVLDQGVVITNLSIDTLKGAKNGYLYVDIQNCSSDKIMLYCVEIEPKICDKALLHDHVMRTDQNGDPYTEAIEVPAIDIDPGKTLRLEDSRKHLLLVNLNTPELCITSKLILKFYFRNAPKEKNTNNIAFEVTVNLPIKTEDQRCKK